MIINAVFSGGGIKGLAYIGALRFLEARGYNIKNAGGSSVGALFASLVVAGYNSHELIEIVNNFDLNLLVKKPKISSIMKLKDMYNKKGIFSMDSFELFVEEILKKKGIQYFRDVKVGNDYRLKIIVTEVTTTSMVIIPDDLIKYNINPDTFSIAKAVAMSCNIPFFYHPYNINGYIFVDGGVSDNYPIWLFDNMKNPTIGFKLLNTEKEQKKWLAPIVKVGVVIKNKVFSTKEVKETSPRTVFIQVDDIKLVDFKKGLEQKKQLYMLGYNSTKDFFYENNLKINF